MRVLPPSSLGGRYFYDHMLVHRFEHLTDQTHKGQKILY